MPKDVHGLQNTAVTLSREAKAKGEGPWDLFFSLFVKKSSA